MTSITAAVEDRARIRAQHLKHIEEISKTQNPLKFARLKQDQQDFLDRNGRYAPYRPTRTIE